MKKKIAILFHEKDRSQVEYYVITSLAEYWREADYEVIFIFGVRQYYPADLILVHVDLSVVPDEYLHFAQQYPIVLNGNVKDIRKSTFSQNLVQPGDAYEGKVIVKTDLNYAGRPEQMVPCSRTDSRSGILKWITSRFRSEAESHLPRFETPHDYQVYDTLREVPEVFLTSQNFIVEKFLPEMEDDLFFVRYLRFLGDRTNAVRLGATSPIVNGRTQVFREIIEPHAEIVELRHKLKFDYGKFDYVLHGGHPILLDTNKTIGAARVPNPPQIEARWRYLAAGIDAYFS
ncbi:MAG: hypothetical protein HY774_01725 [Acidobacteria bacterium]|nr:hypothetical protein [Acidobacteriota bacterium]